MRVVESNNWILSSQIINLNVMSHLSQRQTSFSWEQLCHHSD